MSKNYIKASCILSFLIIFMTLSCDLFSKEILYASFDNLSLYPEEGSDNHFNNKRLWSILIYMAADNDLGLAAIQDICEMELSKLNTDVVSVFILVDGVPSESFASNKNNNTKLYKLKTCKREECNIIISDEIKEIKFSGKNEINMASGNILKHALSFVIKNFPAEYFGLIMWGHGTGFRGMRENNYSKGFAYDDSSMNYMTLKQLGVSLENVLNGRKLDFIGFDTCFSGELEVMYELRDVAKYTVGIEGLIPTNGWDYESIFNLFERDKEKASKSLVSYIVDQFISDYVTFKKGSIVGVDLSKIEDYFKVFDKLMKEISYEINSRNERDTVMNLLFSEKNENNISYQYEMSDSDIYIDVKSMIVILSNYFNDNVIIQNLANDFNEISSQCIISSWSYDQKNGGIGVFFGTLNQGALINNIHPDAYIKNKNSNQIKFVLDSLGYVPNKINSETLLNKLFYTNYNF